MGPANSRGPLVPAMSIARTENSPDRIQWTENARAWGGCRRRSTSNFPRNPWNLRVTRTRCWIKRNGLRDIFLGYEKDLFIPPAPPLLRQTGPTNDKINILAPTHYYFLFVTFPAVGCKFLSDVKVSVSRYRPLFRAAVI